MLILRATVDLLQVVTSAIADIEVHVSAMEADNATPPVVQDIVRTNTASITTATTTTILDCTTANRRRNVKHVNIYNNHASTACLVTVQHTDGTNVEVLAEVNLLASESLIFTQGGVWIHYDANGAVYPSVGNAASQAEMEAGTATDKFVTPQGVNWHPGAAKFWCKAGVAGTASVSWNLTSIGDTGTGIMTPTIATDFSSANWAAFLSIENLDATIDAAADGQICMIGLAGQAAGTLQCINKNEAGIAAADPTQWHVVGFGDQ